MQRHMHQGHQKQYSGVKKKISKLHTVCVQYCTVCTRFGSFVANEFYSAKMLKPQHLLSVNFFFFFFFPEVDDDYLNYFSCKRNYLTIYTLYRDHWKVLPECFLLHFVAWMLPLAKIMHVAMHIPQMLSSERM